MEYDILPKVIQTKKGRIVGVFYYPKKPKTNVPIILTHGSADNLNQYPITQIAKSLSKKGYITFRFDFMGCGSSDGKSEEYCISSQVFDLENVINFVKKELSSKEVGIIAKSLSSIPSFLITSKRKDIKFLICLGAPLRIDKLWKKEEIELAKKKGYVFYKGFKYGYKFARETLVLKNKYIKALKQTKIPTLLLIGEKDQVVSLEDEKHLLSLIGSKTKKLCVIKNADHSFKLKEKNLKDLMKEINWFIKRILL